MEWDSPQELNLPSREQRQRILAQAGTVLAEARALVQRLDEREDQSASRKRVHLDRAVGRDQPKRFSFANWLSR